MNSNPDDSKQAKPRASRLNGLNAGALFISVIALTLSLLAFTSNKPTGDVTEGEQAIAEQGWYKPDVDASPASVTQTSAGISSSFLERRAKQSVLNRLRSTFPEIAQDADITPLGESGLFEVSVNDMTFLVSQDGNYLINHSYFDLTEAEGSHDVDAIRQVTLVEYTGNDTAASSATDERRKGSDDNQVSQSSIDNPAQAAFSWVRDNSIHYPSTTGNTRHELVVFTDVTCPYCRQFHQKYTELNAKGIDIYVALLSRRGNTGSVFEASQVIQCAQNSKELYELAIEESQMPQSSDIDSCAAPAAEMFNIALKFMPSPATPGIWLDGEQFMTINQVLEI